MKDGDIYLWRWKSHEGRFMAYHCRARKAVARNGRLVDTFWRSGPDNYILNLREVDVEYQGNLNEMRTIHDYEIRYYRTEDVVDMRHSNSSGAPIYIKPGAKRDPIVMSGLILSEIQRAEGDIDAARRRIARLRDAQTLVTSGDLDEVRI